MACILVQTHEAAIEEGGDEIPPLFCVLQQYSRPLFSVPTRCVTGTTVQSCHVSFCVSTAAWERSFGSTCLLVVAQRTPFVPSRVVWCR